VKGVVLKKGIVLKSKLKKVYERTVEKMRVAEVAELRKKLEKNEVTHFQALREMIEKGIVSPADVENLKKHFMNKWNRPLTSKELKERKAAITHGVYTGMLEKKGKTYEIPAAWKSALEKYVEK